MNISQLLNIALRFLIVVIFVFSCTPDSPKKSDSSSHLTTPKTLLFELLSSEKTGVNFSNIIQETNQMNYLIFNYLYNGGAIATGDINNDNLADIYLISSTKESKLYLNKGNLQFEDITEQAGVAAAEGIKTGVLMADINNDGWLDIYLCRTGQNPNQRSNLLFINNGNAEKIGFTNQTQKAGLMDGCPSNHANFFDADLDGDLDLYLLNHPTDFSTVNNVRVRQTETGELERVTEPADEYESDRFYRNNGDGTFTNISQEAGVFNRAFGLSATVSDFNDDGYLDIFVANDYIEPDILYINNKKGGFVNEYDSYFRHTAHNSMGVDIADINNDGLEDVIILDMIAEDNKRQKQLMTAMRNDRYYSLLKYGYKEQLTRNMLQLNNGQKGFSEISCMAGVSNTDWSWGPLISDFDNDGLKDIFIANGYKKDVSDLDYVTYTIDSIRKTGGLQQFSDINQYLRLIKSTKIQNYAYKNKGDLTFQKVSDEWGFSEKTFSNGSALADLDNDGDLDLITNNMEDPAHIYENKTRQQGKGNYLQFSFLNEERTRAMGTEVVLDYGNEKQFQVLNPIRGFLSSSQYLVHFGLGELNKIDKIAINWPDGQQQVMENVSANQRIQLKYADATQKRSSESPKASALFSENNNRLSPSFSHQENEFFDFDRERLLPHKLSNLGPALASGDINGDGLDDFFIGNGMGFSAATYLQNNKGQFKANNTPLWEGEKTYEDVAATFFDADGDNDLDVYVVSGGSAETANLSIYQDRLYLNDGKGNFSKAANAIPGINSSGACVAAFDFDKDNDLDLFVGGRVVPGAYPTSPNSYVLQNDGGKFTDVTDKVAPELRRLGMLTDMLWADINKDGAEELLITGEWLPITIFSNDGQQLKNVTKDYGLENTTGWWNTIVVEDFDDDGDMDLVGGNLGLNSRLKVSEKHPLRLYAKDFDQNGSIDPILAYYNEGKEHPLPQKNVLIQQIASLKKKFVRYSTYSNANMEDVYPREVLNTSQQFDAKIFETCYFENTANQSFEVKPLPHLAQFSPTLDIIVSDFNNDGKKDILLAGNTDAPDVETGPYDAGNGLLLTFDGQGSFTPVHGLQSGFWATQQARKLALLKSSAASVIIVANNGEILQFFNTN